MTTTFENMSPGLQSLITEFLEEEEEKEPLQVYMWLKEEQIEMLKEYVSKIRNITRSKSIREILEVIDQILQS